MSKTDENRTNFERWFKQRLEQLYQNVHAGFAVLMITLPLLERQLRELTNTQGISVGQPFFDELLKTFPALQDSNKAQAFWLTYRHVILHRGTVNTTLITKSKGGPMQLGLGDFASSDTDCIAVWISTVSGLLPLRFPKG